MDIFLDNRIIRLLKQSSLQGEGVYINDFHGLEKIYLEFEISPEMQELVLWSDDFGQLKKRFFSLFRIIDAAGGIVVNEQDETLFIFRRGRWDLPKGKIDRKHNGKTESPSEAATREVKEETGLKNLRIIKELDPIYHIYLRKENRILKRTYWFRMLAPGRQRLEPQTEEDITGIQWFCVTDLHIPIMNTYPSLKKMIADSV